MLNKKRVNFHNFPFYFLAILFLFGCAAQQPPQGGPRDLTPPKLVKAIPANKTRNFNAKEISLEFDEFIKLTNQYQEISMSPTMEKQPEYTSSKRILKIKLKDTLQKNTTYVINFGKSIQDVNEGNVLKNFTYVFSTGPDIDSLSISGKVINSLSDEPEKDATVFILPLERDTIFGKRRPSIYTTTDSAGTYKLNNLRKGTYKVYAIKESSGGGDKIYQQISDEVGFIKEPVMIDKNLDNINLQIFKELAPEFRVLDRKLNNDGSISIIFNQQLKSPKITVMDPPAVDIGKYVHFTKNNDTAKIWLKDLSFDSVKVAIQDQGKVLQTLNFTRGKKDTYTRDVTIADNLSGGKLNPFQQLTLTFPFPITGADPSKITLLEDSVKRTNFELVKDSVDQQKYYLKYPWKNKRTYDLKLGAGAFTAIFNAKNKDVSKKFTLESSDAYTTLALNVTVPDTAKNYIVQFLNEKKDVIKSYPVSKNSKILFSKYPAGKYMLRVVYDDNKNGIWDTGSVKGGYQPEKVWYLKALMDLKPNWEREDPLVIPPPTP